MVMTGLKMEMDLFEGLFGLFTKQMMHQLFLLPIQLHLDSLAVRNLESIKKRSLKSM